GLVQSRGTTGDRAPQFVVGQERTLAYKTFATVQRPQRYRGAVRAHNFTPRRTHAVAGPATADAGGSLLPGDVDVDGGLGPLVVVQVAPSVPPPGRHGVPAWVPT